MGSEDLVERVDELAAAVTNQGTSTVELVGVLEEQVSGGLGRPGAGRVRLTPTKNTRRVSTRMKTGGDDPALAEPAGECCGNRGEQSPIIIVHRGPVDLAAEYLNRLRRTMISRSLERPDRTATRARAASRRKEMWITSVQDGAIRAGQHPRASFRAPKAEPKSTGCYRKRFWSLPGR